MESSSRDRGGPIGLDLGGSPRLPFHCPPHLPAVKAEGSKGQVQGGHLAQRPGPQQPPASQHSCLPEAFPARPSSHMSPVPFPPQPLAGSLSLVSPLYQVGSSTWAGILPLTGCAASENEWITLSFCFSICKARGKITSPTLQAISEYKRCPQ